MTDSLEFSEVFSLVRGALNAGRLQLNKTGIVFKSQKTGKIESVPLTDIDSCYWMRVARGFGLKIILKDGQNYKYHGFKEIEYERLKDYYSKNYNVPLREQDLCVKGWNWGSAKFKGAIMSFEVDNKAAFEIPLRDVSQATTGKNEVTIEFHRNDDAKVALMEMRFFVPAYQDENAEDPVKEFHEQIISKADIIQATGDAIVTFAEVACLTPRGRYSIRVYPTFLQLHGKTYDYKIPHTTVLRLFLLPHQDNRFMFFVVSMDPPLRQGQTRYPFLILQFERDEEMTCKLNLTEEELEKKYNNKLSSEMSGSVFEVVSRVLKEVCQRKITVPGSFKSNSGTSAITCSYKASNGLLYPLERGFIFVHKPPVHIRFEEISAVNFARGSTTGRTFDFDVDLKNGTSVTFSSLPREEYDKLFDFVNTKKLHIKNKGNKSVSGNLNDMFESDEEEHDAYLKQVKAEGRERDDEAADDDDSEEEDEDFNPANEKEDDVKEEFDSDVSDSSGDDEDEDEDGEEKKKKKKKRKSESKHKESKPKKAKREESSSSKKKKKDKNAPKRPMSAYMLFLNSNREKIKADNPGIAFTDIAKKGAELWKNVGDAKEKWENLAKEAKVRYEKEMKEYKEKLKESGGAPSPAKKSKSIKDMMKKKETPKKEGDNTKFKSKEYIETDDDSSSSDDDDATEKKSSPAEVKTSKSTRSKRGKGDDEALVALDEGSAHEEEEEAEFSGEQSSNDDDSD